MPVAVVMVTVIVPMIIMTAPMIIMIAPMAVVIAIMALTVVVMILVLAVVITIVVTNFVVVLVPVPAPFPTCVTAPVGAFTAYGIWAVIAKARIIVMVDVAAKTYRTAEPWSCAQEHATRKPLRTVISERCALIRRVAEVAVGANRRHANADADLCL